MGTRLSVWRRLLMAVAVIAGMGLLWTAHAAQAQELETMRLSTLEISLWPEFDKAELLVILQGRLADAVPLPARLTLIIPKDAGEPHAVASVDEEGRRLTAAYEAQAIDGGIEVTYTSLQDRAFQLEYYWDVLQVEGDQHAFTFGYQLDAPVDDLALVLQQPVGATDVVLDPAAVEAAPGFAGLTYHRLPLGAADAGQAVEWRVSYRKSGFGLSSEVVSASEATGETAPDSSLASSPGFGIVALVGLALAAALGGLWLVGSRRQAGQRRRKTRSREEDRLPRSKGRKGGKDRKGRQRQPRTTPQARRLSSQPQPPPAERPAPTSTPVGGYCHQCGAPLKEGALFCHHCGTRRKGAG
jgi:hypothetical protein